MLKAAGLGLLQMTCGRASVFTNIKGRFTKASFYWLLKWCHWLTTEVHTCHDGNSADVPHAKFPSEHIHRTNQPNLKKTTTKTTTTTKLGNELNSRFNNIWWNCARLWAWGISWWCSRKIGHEWKYYKSTKAKSYLICVHTCQLIVA